MRRILTIAGSDSGGGAGIQADVKTIFSLGAHPLTVITALTAQNSRGVDRIFEVPVDFVISQLKSVLNDMPPHATKTGMLLEEKIVLAVGKIVEKYHIPLLIVDPVILSSSGSVLLSPDSIDAMKERLFPLATVVTPNLQEAEVLSGLKVSTTDEMIDAAKRISEFGPANVLVTGGHLKQECVDILYDGKAVYRFEGPRIDSEDTHGTGCVFSSALATFLAQGTGIGDGVRKARDLVRRAIIGGVRLGQGPGPVQPPRNVEKE